MTSRSGRRVLSHDDIRAEAEQFLQDYHEEGTIPVPIEEIVEFDFEIELVPVPGIKEDLHVDAFLTSDLKSIVIDEYVLLHVPTRYRFSLAHELGHLWLHQDLFELHTIRTVADFRRIQAGMSSDDYYWFEWQANTFAGLVLVPPDSLRVEFESAVRRAMSMGLNRKQIESYPARQRITDNLSARFGVSELAMAIRLEKDGHLPPLAGIRRD